jgi:hypothetical protein
MLDYILMICAAAERSNMLDYILMLCAAVLIGHATHSIEVGLAVSFFGIALIRASS